MHRKQQPQRSAHGVDHELKRGVVAICTPPLIDEEVHRHQTNFPEYKEDQQVNGHEHAEHPGFQEQEQHHVRFDAVCHTERSQNGKRCQQGGQKHHRKGNPIYTNVEGRMNGFIPGILFFKLIAGYIRIKLIPQHKRQEEGDQTGRKGEPTLQLGIARQEEHY